MQPYFDQTKFNIEDDLNFVRMEYYQLDDQDDDLQREENLNFLINIRQPHFLQMKDDLIFSNTRWPQFLQMEDLRIMINVP